ncbi:hypothetical protein ACO0LC_12375 [Undibacterium sp. JH2W]|uniref:hypothetical protein n=1 Tax=Undibacterium sp. JH2W TaxID=3413037 RepID=UPI003BF099D2
MKNILLKILCCAAFFTHLNSSCAADSDRDTAARMKEQRLNKEAQQERIQMLCSSALIEEASAVAARDWENLERLAKVFLAKCEKTLVPDEYKFISSTYGNLALSYVENGKYKDALIASDRCTKTNYSNFNCFIVKARALTALDKNLDASKALDIGERLAKNSLETARRDLILSSNASDKEVQKSKIVEAESNLEFIDIFRKQLALKLR